MDHLQPGFLNLSLRIISRLEDKAGSDDIGKIVYVTSAARGEGKTFIARGISISIAQSSLNKVLLVDGNMEAPCLHSIFSCDNSNGLSNILESQKFDKMKPHKTTLGNLDVLPAGTQCRPGLLYKKHLLSQFVGHIKQYYDLVIIDAAPLLSTGSNSLTHLIDGMVVVIEAARTRSEIIKEALYQASPGGAPGANILGTVLNKKPKYIPDSIYKFL
jgi:capsular exopolysaccharide synthesis family protein